MKFAPVFKKVLKILGWVIPQNWASKALIHAIVFGGECLVDNTKTGHCKKFLKALISLVQGYNPDAEIININELKKQLTVDEGRVNEVYIDSKGYPTFGIGHLITKDDVEFDILMENVPFIFDKRLSLEAKQMRLERMEYTLKVSNLRISQVFDADAKSHCDDCLKVFPEFASFKEEVKQIIANMVFNMGLDRFKGFKKLIKAINKEDYKEAAFQMKDSKWNKDVKKRAKRLIKRMNRLA